MYEIGDVVVYGWNGVCRVSERARLDFAEGEYYVLRPIASESTVYVPVDSERLVSRMHRLLDRETLEGLLASPEIAVGEWIENEAARKSLSREVLESGDRAAILRLCRTFRARRAALLGVGKHLRQSDEKLLRDAERILCDEISYVLGIPHPEAEALLEGAPTAV